MPNFSLSYTSYQTILYIWIALAMTIFFLLLKITAPYGRHTKSNWGPLVSNRLGWLLMELPVLIVLFIFLVPTAKTISFASWFLIGLFCLHYFNRIFIFPFRIRTKGKKMPFVIMLSAVFFNIMNGFSFGYYFSQFANYTNYWFSDIRFICGLILFFTGLYITWKADNQLIPLLNAGEKGK